MRALRKRSPDDVRAICVSGYGMKRGTCARAARRVFNEHLIKPISLDRWKR
jgi:hypothetical protein